MNPSQNYDEVIKELKTKFKPTNWTIDNSILLKIDSIITFCYSVNATLNNFIDHHNLIKDIEKTKIIMYEDYKNSANGNLIEIYKLFNYDTTKDSIDNITRIIYMIKYWTFNINDYTELFYKFKNDKACQEIMAYCYKKGITIKTFLLIYSFFYL